MLIKFLTSLAIVALVATLAAPAMAGGMGDDRKGSHYGKDQVPAIVVDDTLNGSLNDKSTHTKTDTTTTTTTKTKTETTDNSDNSFNLKLKDTPIAVDNKDSAVAQDGSDANIKSHNDFSQTTHIKDSFKFFDERCQNCTNVTATMTQTTGGKIYYDLSGTGGTATNNSYSGAKAKGGEADAKVISGDGGNAKANGGNSGDAYADGLGGKAYSKGEGGEASADGGSSGDVTANTKAGGSLGGNAKAIDKDSGYAKIDGKGHHEHKDQKLGSGKDQAAAWGGDAKGGHASGADATTGDADGGTAKSKGEGDEALAYGKGGKADTGDADGGTATAGNAKGGKAVAGDASGNAFAKASGTTEANGHGGKLVLTNKSIMENAVRNNAGITNVANGSGNFNNVGNMSTVSFSLNTGTIK